MKLFVATPAYGGHVNVQYMQSMLNLQQLLNRQNVDMQFYTIPFDSLIPRARNYCVMEFLKTDCTHMIFIDADIQFHAVQVYMMMKEDKDILCGIYAKKAIDFEKVKEVAPNCENIRELVEKCARYNINGIQGTQVVNGVMEVKYAPTGFMMIKKKALKEFIKEHPELKYKNDIRAYGMDTETYDLFKCGVVDERYLSEDFYFCHMWRESGRKIYADLKVNTSHFGQFAFHASPVNLLHK